MSNSDTGMKVYPLHRRHLRRCRDRLHHHGDRGHLSSHGPGHQGFGIDHGPAYRSLSRGDHPFVENSLGDEVGWQNDHDGESAHDALGVEGPHVHRQNATKLKEAYEPTALRQGEVEEVDGMPFGTSIFNKSSLPIRLLCIS